MDLKHRITLIDPDDENYIVRCKALSISLTSAEEGIVNVPGGSLRFIIDKGLGITTDWTVSFEETPYKILSVSPYINKPLPKRLIITCEPTNF